MQAHPMIVPFAAPDSPAVAKLSPDGQAVFRLLYDMVSAYTLGRPQWRLERWIVVWEEEIYAAERWQMIGEGWRSIPSHRDFPRRNLFQLPSELPLPLSATEVILESVERPRLVRKQTNLGDFIGIMANEGFGRPSTFAVHAEKLLSRKWIVSSNDVGLTQDGLDTLAKIRASDAKRYNVEFCRAFLAGLDDIDDGKRSPRDCLNEWIAPQDANLLSSWIEGLEIQGDLAAITYEARDELDRTTIAWPAGWLPAEVDPELALPPDSAWRKKRANINQFAANSVGDQWLRLSVKQRTTHRIKVSADEEGLGVKEWEDRHRFDLLARWLVGWFD